MHGYNRFVDEKSLPSYCEDKCNAERLIKVLNIAVTLIAKDKTICSN